MSKIEELKKQIEELDKQRIELQNELELEKKKMEVEYPFEEDDLYWSIDIDGDLCQDQWYCSGFDKKCFKLGNAFKTEQEAEKERDKRILLTRFRQFRDKCNGDWKPTSPIIKNYILFDSKEDELKTLRSCTYDEFHLFGYFKNEEDAERAIELFGDEIKRLWVDE